MKGAMYIFDLDRWEEILVTLTRNKTRSLLTAFGIFWGIFMLIALLGGGQGLRAEMGGQFDGFATNSCAIFSSSTGKPYKGFRKGRYWNLEALDVERLRQSVQGIETITPLLMNSTTATREEYSSSCGVRGIEPQFAAIETPRLRYGRYINETDLAQGRKVCVLGDKVYGELFPAGGDPCGSYVKLQGSMFCVVGVLRQGSNTFTIGQRAEETVLLPLSAMRSAFGIGGKRIDLIFLTAREGHSVMQMQPQIKETLCRAHTIDPTDDKAVSLLNISALFSMVDSLFSGIDILVWMVGLGTLLSGIIGVSNILMVTVRERTVEFGIRRAIGARPIDVLVQVLWESVVLTLVAGMAGISLAVGILSLMGDQFLVSFGLVLSASLLLALLGCAAGIAPALRALHIKPIEAIREE